MTAYAAAKRGLKVTVLEKGKALEARKCPAGEKVGCRGCKVCSIVSGYAGAGAFSDGKFNLGTAYGGTLGEELGEETAMKYILMADKILEGCSGGDWPEVYGVDRELGLKCLQNGLKLLDMNVRHLGTDRNAVVMGRFVKLLGEMGVEMYSECKVVDVKWDESVGAFKVAGGISRWAKNVVFATGRGGAEMVERFCRENGVEVRANAVDLGVRVEMKDMVWREFSEKIYEPKILYRTKTFEDQCRMFCFNKGGVVSAENNGGIVTANGHAYGDNRTDNCNFAILTSINFTEPFNKPTEYAKSVSSLANMIGNGNVLVQRFGDLIRGRRSTEERMGKGNVKPTLKATPGDLSLVLPHRVLVDIIETVEALDKVAPGTANDDTLLYGCESKYYSIRPAMDEEFCVMKKRRGSGSDGGEVYDGCEDVCGVYVVGDGSGVCRGLSQSAAMGLYVGEKICENVDERKM